MSNLPQIRSASGYSQMKLAELTGISQSTISQIEQGRTYPQAVTRYKIEKILGPVDWIATKLHGSINLTAYEENESGENRVIREIELYARTSQNTEQAYQFVSEYTGRRIRKTRLMAKIYKSLNGEKVSFTKQEKKLIDQMKPDINKRSLN